MRKLSEIFSEYQTHIRWDINNWEWVDGEIQINRRLFVFGFLVWKYPLQGQSERHKT